MCAGFLYCFLAEVNHQGINKNLSEKDYGRAAYFMKHTGVQMNSYSNYKKWGSIATPWYTIALWLGNWTFWYIIFYLIGGHALACTFFYGCNVLDHFCQDIQLYRAWKGGRQTCRWVGF